MDETETSRQIVLEMQVACKSVLVRPLTLSRMRIESQACRWGERHRKRASVQLRVRAVQLTTPVCRVRVAVAAVLGTSAPM